LVLAFVVPLVAVFLRPGAVAGATLLVRDLIPYEEGGTEDDGDEDQESTPSVSTPE
jgi:CysZ protein